MLIRPFSPADQDAVIQLWLASGLLAPHNNPVKDIERKLQVNPEWFLVGLVDDRIVASCMVGYEGHRGWINYLAVHPDLQGLGFGRLLMERAEEILRSVGCPKLNLQVRATNEKVIGFYQTLGFQVEPIVNLGKRLEPDTPFDPGNPS